jgi:excisionase family DNA binding protein
MSEPLSTDPSGPGPTASGDTTWVSAAEAGRLCGVTERTVRRWVAAGHLAADMSGPTLRIAVADLQPYIDAAAMTLPAPGQSPRPPSGRRRMPGPDGPDAAAPAEVRTDVSGHGPDHPPDMSRELVDVLQGQVADLREMLAEQRVELEARRREVSELHVLLQRAQQLALPAPAAAPGPEKGSPTGTVSPRPWWTRWAWWR